MGNYDELTTKQKELYNKIGKAIEDDGDIVAVLLEGHSEENLKQVFAVKQENTLPNGTKRLTTPLGYAIDNKNIETILQLQSINGRDLLKEILTAKQEVIFLDSNEYVLTLIGYAMCQTDGGRKIETILKSIEDKGLLEEILTAKQAVNGKDYTLIEFAEYIGKQECAQIIREKLQELGFLTDERNSHLQVTGQQSRRDSVGSSASFYSCYSSSTEDSELLETEPVSSTELHDKAADSQNDHSTKTFFGYHKKEIFVGLGTAMGATVTLCTILFTALLGVEAVCAFRCHGHSSYCSFSRNCR